MEFELLHTLPVHDISMKKFLRRLTLTLEPRGSGLSHGCRISIVYILESIRMCASTKFCQNTIASSPSVNQISLDPPIRVRPDAPSYGWQASERGPNRPQHNKECPRRPSLCPSFITSTPFSLSPILHRSTPAKPATSGSGCLSTTQGKCRTRRSFGSGASDRRPRSATATGHWPLNAT